MADRPFYSSPILWLFVVCLLAVCGLFLLTETGFLHFFASLHVVLDNGEILRDKFLYAGRLAPVLFVGLQMLQILFAPIPGEATGLLGGYLFGFWQGFFLSTIGLALGSWLAFIIGRFFGDLVGERLRRTEAYTQFDGLVHKGDFVIPFLLFLIPGFPKDILSYILGLSRMPLPVFMFISAVGRIPGTLLLSIQGANVYQRNFEQFVLVSLLALLIFAPTYYFRKRLLRHFDQTKKENGK
ncbi:MAG: TVP38/TMEM64 family protein [Deltaproteobacteria bacterium]